MNNFTRWNKRRWLIDFILLVLIAVLVLIVKVGNAQELKDLRCVGELSDMRLYSGRSGSNIDLSFEDWYGEGIWLGYGEWSDFGDLSAEGFNWTATPDRYEKLTIQGRRTSGNIGQVSVYASDSLDDVYWVLGYSSLRSYPDRYGKHMGIHPCVAFRLVDYRIIDALEKERD